MARHALISFGRMACAVTVFCAISLAVSAASASGPTERLGLNGTFMLSVGKSGKCLAKANGANMGQQMHAWSCRDGASAQKFKLLERERGWYLMLTATGRMCLDVSGSAVKNGAPVVQWGCQGGANQLWQVLPDGGSNRFQLRARHSGRCLHLDKIGGQISTFVQRDCKRGEPAQTFFVTK